MALPCGHVYCHECILSKIESDITHPSIHRCPSCRNQYSITNIDPNAVPGHLRNRVLPALRRIYLDEVQQAPPPPVDTEAEVSKLRAENAILRAYCDTWKRRANLHAAVIYGVAKVAREQILTMRTDRDQLEQKYQNLKRKYADFEASSSSSSTSTVDLSTEIGCKKRSRPEWDEPGSENWTSTSPVVPPKKKLRGLTMSSDIKLEPTD